MRIGNGYDIHRLEEGRKLILGGVNIPFEKGLLGHSDADVLIHSIMDAMLGALALGDIGKHFPPTDNKYKDISSITLLEHVNSLIKDKGYSIVNIDNVIQAQEPKLMPHITTMQEKLAKTLGIDIDQVSVKATTTEKLGAIGEVKAIACYSVILLKKD